MIMKLHLKTRILSTTLMTIFLPVVVLSAGVVVANEAVTLENVDALIDELGIEPDGRAGLNLPKEPLKE